MTLDLYKLDILNRILPSGLYASDNWRHDEWSALARRFPAFSGLQLQFRRQMPTYNSRYLSNYV